MRAERGRALVRGRLRNVALELNSGAVSLDAILARSNRPKRIRVRRLVPVGDVLRRVCERCLEPRARRDFPADERPNHNAPTRDSDFCVCCLQEAREAEAVRRLVHGDVSAWAAYRISTEGLILEPWSSRSTCGHCGRGMPQTSAYTWACRRGTGAGVCEGLTLPHVHSVCRLCAYEGLFDKPNSTPKRRIG